MSNRKFVVHRTTNVTGKPVIYFAAAVAAVGACAPAARAESAADIYKKMTSVYTNAKSFSGTIVRVEQGKTPDGKAATQSVSVKITYKAPNKYAVENKRSVHVGSKSESSDQFMVTDGKSLFLYSPEKKLYQRGVVQNDNLLARYFAVLNPSNGFSMLPETTLNGRPVLVLKPNAPTTGTPQQLAAAKNVKISVMIDKKTYQFLKLTIASATGSLSQTVNGQTVNGNIPDSVFAWSPPASYKELKAPGASGPAGAPTVGGKAPGK